MYFNNGEVKNICARNFENRRSMCIPQNLNNDKVLCCFPFYVLLFYSKHCNILIKIKTNKISIYKS